MFRTSVDLLRFITLYFTILPKWEAIQCNPAGYKVLL